MPHPKTEPGLYVGCLVRYDSRIWRVGYVSDLRARLDPVSTTSTWISGGDHRGTEIPYYTGSVNVSPNSVLDELTWRDLTDKELERVTRLEERDNKVQEAAVMAQEVTVPQPTVSSVQLKNKERLAALAAKKAAKPGPTAVVSQPVAVKAVRAKAPQAPKEMKPCKCGCGEQVASFFLPGHDARFKSWLLKLERGQIKLADLPPVVQKSYKWVKKGEGVIPTTNYKGEPHGGYDVVVAE